MAKEEGMWLREHQAKYWKQATHTIEDSLKKGPIAINEENFCTSQRSLNYLHILALWGPTLLLIIIWIYTQFTYPQIYPQFSPLYFTGVFLAFFIATIHLISIIYGQKNAHRRAAQQASRLLPAVLEMTEALLLLPSRASEQEEGAQAPVEDGVVEQQLLKLTCNVLKCSAAAVLVVDPLTNQVKPIARATATTDLEQPWLSYTQDTYLQDLLCPEQIQQLQAGEIIQHSIQEENSLLGTCDALITPIQIRGRLQGLFVLVYKKTRQYLTQECLVQTKALARTLARMLEREQRLHEHIEVQAGELVLRSALRRMDESVSLISHELKTPLTAIHINAQMAQHRVKRLNTQELLDTQQTDCVRTINDVQNLLERIESQVRIQNRLIDDLLDVPRRQTDQLKLETRRFNLAELVHEVVEEQRLATPARSIIDAFPCDTEIPVFADRDRIRQVIYNYLTNAIKYAPADQPVILLLTSLSEEARVSVSDRGPGLSEDEQERIWQRFYQAPNIQVQKGNSRGLGLGLHICRTIIEQHRGQIGVSSTPGNGSTFWFTLPLAP
jgi:signal transduction histidine kinase